MTVKELKEKLNYFDENLTVVIYDKISDFLEIIVEKDITVSKENAKVIKDGEKWVLANNITDAEEVIYIY